MIMNYFEVARFELHETICISLMAPSNSATISINFLNGILPKQT